MDKKETYEKINTILLNDWDPVSIHNVEDWPKDEYEGYVPQLYALKSKGADIEMIVDELIKIEKESFGFEEKKESREGYRKIAKKILEVN